MAGTDGQVRGIAHRGYSGRHVENSVAAIDAALTHDFSHVEIDVQLSSDGVPVLIHDFTVKRLTGHPGRVVDYSLQELQAMSFGGSDQGIATLEEVLRLAHGRARVVVELKQAGHLYPGLEEKALGLLRATDTFDQALIISFDHFCIQRVRRLDADVAIGLTTSCAMPYVFDFMTELRCELLGVPTRMLTPEYDRMITEHGITVGPWVVDSEEDMEDMALHYPHALITTNQVERWKDVWQRHPELHT